MNKAMVTMVGAAALLLTACGGNDASDDSAASEAPATSEAGATTAADATKPTVYQVGQTVENGGLTVTVTSVETVPSIAVSGAGGVTDRESPTGMYVVLDAVVVNGTSSGIDLSCGKSIGNRLVDTEKRQFDVISDLDAVEGNRPCGDQVGPGTDGQVRWVFAVDADSQPKAFGFYNTETQQPTEVKVVDLAPE